MKRFSLLLIYCLLLTIYTGFGSEILSTKIVGNRLELIIKSHEKLIIATFEGEPYPLEQVEKNSGYFVYRVLIEVPLNDLVEGTLTLYSSNASKQVLRFSLETSNNDEFKKLPIPSTLYVIGSQKFGEFVIQNIGDQFEKTEILPEGLDNVAYGKNAVLIFENVAFDSLETFRNFLTNISNTFEMSFILIISTKPKFPLIVPYSEIPENISFVILNNFSKDFFNVIPYIDNDGDGWIEASEIANAFDSQLFYDEHCIPFIRSATYPEIPDEELRMKLKTLVFDGILNIGDIEKCMKDFKSNISPPWLNEYLIGKLKITDLKRLKKLYFW